MALKNLKAIFLLRYTGDMCDIYHPKSTEYTIVYESYTREGGRTVGSGRVATIIE